MSHEPGSLPRATPQPKSQSIVERSGAALLQPYPIVLALAALQFLLWGPLAAVYDPAPPTDSLEQVLFSQDLRLFYVKHPALPTWLLYLVNRWRGPSIETTFLLGALCATATLLLLFLWTRPLIGARRAALVTLLTSTIVFLNVGAIQYNNNTVQLPLAMLSIVLFHRALTHGGWKAWALLGAAAGLFTLAKLSAVVLFASFALYLYWTGRLRERATWQAIGVAGATFAALVLPPVIAAHSIDPASNHYAWIMLFPPELDRTQRLVSVWNFVASQLAAIAPAVLLFFFLRRRSPPAAVPEERVPFVSFVSIVGFGPMVLTVLVSVLAGVRLLSGWGTTFHVLVPLWLVAASGFAIEVSRGTLARAVVACGAIHMLLWTAMIGNGGALPTLYEKAARQTPPAPAALAQVVRDRWSDVSPTPLRFVVADIRTGAPLSIAFGGDPRVVDGNRPDFALEFPPEARAACGFVAVTSRPPALDPDAPNYDPLDDALNAAAPLTPVTLTAPDGSRRDYYVGVRPPSNNAECEIPGSAPTPRPDDIVD
jgi:4-amino-4-deoxy-L-arabinose transferase-like glycosyltransferase